MFLMSAALLVAMQTIPEFAVVEVREGRRGCEYRAEQRRVSEKQLEHRARVWARQGRTVEIQGDRNIAYRCVGSAMFILQSAGVEKVSYVGKPIRAGVVLLGTEPKGCVPTVNGEALTMAQFGAEASRWSGDKAEIIFSPDRNTDYKCVDAILTVIKQNSGIKLGFVGDERNGTQ